MAGRDRVVRRQSGRGGRAKTKRGHGEVRATTATPPIVRRILIPTDYSACADQALAWAVLLGRMFGAAVTVLHVVERHLHFGTFGYTDGHDAPDLPAERARLDAHVKARLAESGLAVATLVEVGTPPIKIREVARREQADLIIMGTHGTSRLEDLVFGSVTEKVVHHTGCPVLVVPPPAEPA
jgi:nucleotide-binding universal stress UspA family protein